jgi:long-chain acyl-CoA synthetase
MENFVGLSDMIKEHARSHPDSRAFIFQDRVVSWAQWDRRLNRVANALLSLGLVKDDKVAILSGNSIEAVEAYFGAVRAGLCAVPLSPMAAPDALKAMIDDCDAKALFVSSTTRQRISAVEEQLFKLSSKSRIGFDFADPDWINYDDLLAGSSDTAPDIALKANDSFNIIYSSGTTGVPKGILHSHAQRLGIVTGTDRWHFGPHTVNLVSTPIYSNTTMAAMLPTLAAGGANLLMGKFDERRFLELSQDYAVTHAIMVPVQYQRVLAVEGFSNFDLSSYQLKLCTGAPLSVETKREIIERWPGRLIEIYGLTEGGAVCLLDATKYPDKLHTVGRPSLASDVRIIDEQGNELPQGQIGEIVGRQQVMMKGYYNRREATEAIMWYDAEGNRFQRTEDLGRFDQDGFIELLDRKKDVIISGGFNVFPADLEAVLLQHEAVDDAAVIGIPSKQWGETPLALIVLKTGYALDPETLRIWANQRLGKNQRISAVEIRKSIPRSALGKVLKNELRAPYWREKGD